MKIKKIEIENVRSFKDHAPIEFDSKINILIGSNASGKSNLLDIINLSIKYFFLIPYRIVNDVLIKPLEKGLEKRLGLEKHYENKGGEMSLQFHFQVDQGDIDNIKNIRSKSEEFLDAKNKLALKNLSEKSFVNLFEIADWGNFEVGELIEISIQEYQIQDNPDEAKQQKQDLFIKYLNFYEFALILNSFDEEIIQLNSNFLFFSPYRGPTKEQPLQATLSSQTYKDALQLVHSANSRSNNSLIHIATIYFGEKRRKLEDEHRKNGWQCAWNKDPEVVFVSKYLKRLGYTWGLRTLDLNKNTYEIELTKDENTTLTSQASSGEIEMVNYILGIFAFKIQDGIIVIDEPELHLHPRWKNLLVDLFRDLSSETPNGRNNQFFISTHSASFVNPKTLSNVTRVYKEGKASKAVSPFKDHEKGSIKNKDLFSILHSTNNEKFFFADLVILVEGITDRVIFQRLVRDKIESEKLLSVIEVIDIGGKYNREKFKEILDNLKVPNFFIGDRDCINDLECKCMKELLDQCNKGKETEGNGEKIEKNTYYEEKFDIILNKIIDCQKEKGIFILKEGEIEDYLPKGFKKKGLENVLPLLEEGNYQSWGERCHYEGFKALQGIVDEIIDKLSSK